MASLCSGQAWRAVGGGVIGPTTVRTIFGDPIQDRLLAGGDFVQIVNDNDTVLGIGLAAWDGLRWDSLAHRIQPYEVGSGCLPIFWLLRFENRLYACGAFPLNDGILPWNTGFARLNEATMQWERLECLNDGTLFNLVPKEPDGNSIYATGQTETLCGYPESCVFRYDGSAFHEWPPWALIPEWSANFARYVFEFRGKTYLTGNFRDPLGPGYVSFLRWNDSAANWEYVPGWGAYSQSINDMSIHNDTLYVSGNFRVDNGGPGNCIAYFDGENWNDMGGGVSYAPSPNNASCLTMQWYHDDLWVSGQMDHAGGIPIDAVAKWNGRQWCSLPGDFTNPVGLDRVLDFTVWRDSLYVCGGFVSIDGEPIRQVAQWIGGDATLECSSPVSVAEQVMAGIAVAPNPASDQLRISGLSAQASAFAITDALGRTVRTGKLKGNEVDIAGLAAGHYVMRVLGRRNESLAQVRFVKE